MLSIGRPVSGLMEMTLSFFFPARTLPVELYQKIKRTFRCSQNPFLLEYPGYFSSLSNRALMATITVLADINTAPSAGVSSTPHA